ncbi:nitroreductase family protein [Streptomyces diacarni]|uniref:nitroreductase family protein n=1 Tax=Streptomyces diacarni TaxID=2800381 RepID=UPI0015F10547|nr:nitroreductase family protein [Streptomyces diacarni]
MIAPDDLALQLVESFQHAPAQPHADVPPQRADHPRPLGPDTRIGRGTAETERLDLLDTLRTRRASRLWSPEPLPAPLLADIVGEGVTADVEEWPDEQHYTPLEITVVAFRVAGMEPAVHRFDGPARTTRPVMELPPPERRRTLTLQAEFGDAPAIVSVAVDPHTAELRDGGHGYRTLLTRAGAAVHTMWLAGVSHGLTGSAFAGFIPASVRTPLRSDGTSRQQVFALALGHPPADPPGGGAAPPPGAPAAGP